MQRDRSTLTQFLIEERRRYPEARGELNSLILNVALACKAIAKRVAYGCLDPSPDSAHPTGGGRAANQLAAQAHEVFVRTTEWGGELAGMISPELARPHPIPARYARGKYLLIFTALDGASNLEVNLPVSTIFSIQRARRPGADATLADFLQPGRDLLCAGYAIYGPSTMLVISVGTGVHGFTLDPQLGEFVLTHPALTIAPAASAFAVHAASNRFWEPAVKRYVDECVAGQAGPRGKDFHMRWAASVVAETHRILLRGGVFLHPRDLKASGGTGSLGLLYEASPISMLVEQAGGLATSGRTRIRDLLPATIAEPSEFIFGAHDEVSRLEQYYRDSNEREYDAPLFGTRGLFSSKG